jgi:hypothetical protein
MKVEGHRTGILPERREIHDVFRMRESWNGHRQGEVSCGASRQNSGCKGIPAPFADTEKKKSKLSQRFTHLCGSRWNMDGGFRPPSSDFLVLTKTQHEFMKKGSHMRVLLFLWRTIARSMLAVHESSPTP